MTRPIAIMNAVTTLTRKEQRGFGLLAGDWREQLAFIVEAMREMSLQSDPQAMVRSYGSRIRQLMPSDRWISISRRELDAPCYRITRSSTWTESINPWKDKERLPLLEGGLLGELIYGDEPRLIDDLRPLLATDDPAFEYLDGFRSLMAVPYLRSGDGTEYGHPAANRSRRRSTTRRSRNGSGSAACSAGQRTIWSWGTS